MSIRNALSIRTPLAIRTALATRNLLRLALVPSALLLLSCASGGGAAKEEGGLAQSADPCGEVRTLIEGHADGFKSLRGAHTRSRFADIWQANYHAVGNACEIWQAGKGAVRYVCSRAAPDAEVAREYHDKAVTNLRACLDASWKTVAETRPADSGFQTRFERDGSPTVVLIQGVQAQNVLSPQWTVFYSIGDFRNP